MNDTTFEEKLKSAIVNGQCSPDIELISSHPAVGREIGVEEGKGGIFCRQNSQGVKYYIFLLSTVERLQKIYGTT